MFLVGCSAEALRSRVPHAQRGPACCSREWDQHLNRSRDKSGEACAERKPSGVKSLWLSLRACRSLQYLNQFSEPTHCPMCCIGQYWRAGVLNPACLGSNPSSITEEPCDSEARGFIFLCLSFFISKMRLMIALPHRVVVKTEDVNI